MSYPDLRKRPFNTITAEEANQMYVKFMKDYRDSGTKPGKPKAPPHETVVHWPTESEFSQNYLLHPAEDGYATLMGVDMAIDVGGPACRVFYQQAKGDLVHWDPNNYQPLALYSRSATSPGTADTKWRDLSHSQQKPHIELPDGTSFCLLPRVVLPRHVPLTPQVVKVHTITNNVSLFTEPHTVAPPGMGNELWTETWTVLRVRQTEFWKGKVAEDDLIDGGPSSPDTTFLQLDLAPSPRGTRHASSEFVLFSTEDSGFPGLSVSWVCPSHVPETSGTSIVIKSSEVTLSNLSRELFTPSITASARIMARLTQEEEYDLAGPKQHSRLVVPLSAEERS